MKKNSLRFILKSSYLLSLSLILISCNQGSSHDQKQQNNLQIMNVVGKDVPGVDLYSLNYDIRKNPTLKEARTVCFENSAVCITQKSDILGTYTLQQGKIAWIMPDSLGMFNITLDPNRVKGGVRTNSLSANTNNNGVQGYITELDDRDCNQDLSIGAKTCNIRYGYIGVAANDKKTNTHHLVLTWIDNNGSVKTGDFTFDTYNVFYGVQNIPVINMIGGSEVNHLSNPANEYNNEIYFMNSINNQITLQNVGDKILEKEPDHPLFDIGRAQTNKSLNMDDLEFHDPTQPISCKYSDRLNIKDICKFDFDYTRKYEEIGDKEVMSSQLGRLIFVHYPIKDEPRVNYTQKFILSAGHIQSGSINTILNESFELNLENIHSMANDTDPAVLSYQLPKTDVKLSIEYNPGFYVSHVEKNNTIYYGVGSDAQTLTNSLRFTSIKNTSGDFLANDGNIENSSLGYKVTSTIYEGVLPEFAPVGGLLIATYWSPVANRDVRQIVGTIDILIDENYDFQKIVPYGEYDKIFNTSYLLTIINPSTNVPDVFNHMAPYCYKPEYDQYKHILRASCGNSVTNKFQSYGLDVSKCKKDTQGRYSITLGNSEDYSATIPVCGK